MTTEPKDALTRVAELRGTAARLAREISKLDPLARLRSLEARRELDLFDVGNLLSCRYTAQREILGARIYLLRASVVEQLLFSADHVKSASPFVLLVLAQACLAILAQAGPARLGGSVFADLLARALLLASRGLILASRLNQAENACRAALAASRHGSSDRDLRSKALRRLGRLLSAGGRHAEAHRLLRALARIHAEEGERTRLAKVLLSLSNNFLLWGYPDQALQACEQALELLDPRADREDYAKAVINYAWLAIEFGHTLDAETLSFLMSFFRRRSLPTDIQLRATWVQARFHRREGDLESAERKLRALCDAYADADRTAAFCLASLDLCLVLLEQGRCRDIPALCLPLLDLLQERGQADRVRALAVLIIEKAATGTLHPYLIRELATILEQAPGQVLKR